MRVVVQNTLTNRQAVAFEGPAGFTVGRDAACEVRLESRFVSGTHFKVERAEVGWEVELFANVSPVEINGTEVKPGQKVQFRDEAIVKIMEFVLTMEDGKAAGAAPWPEPSGTVRVQVHYKIRSTLSEQELSLLLTSGG